VPKQSQHQTRTIAVLNIGRMDDGNKHQPKNIYEQMAFAAIDLLASIVAVRPPFSVVLTDWLSMIGSARLPFSPSRFARIAAQFIVNPLPGAIQPPTPKVVIDGFPMRQVMRQ